jgi:reactive intermediate/imine deaminase
LFWLAMRGSGRKKFVPIRLQKDTISPAFDFTQEFKLKTLLTLAVIGLLSIAASAAQAQRKYIPEKPGNAPFSTAVISGDTVYLSGVLGLDPKTGQAPADAKVEIKLVMEAVKQSLEQSGLTMDDLVSVQIYCTDMALYDPFNEIYRTYFKGRFPARAFLGTNALLRGAHFEIMAIATKDKK